jgi:WD40 repeat protein
MWDIQKGELLHNLRGHEGWIWGFAFSPDSKIMASGGDDRTILLWDVETGKSLGILEEYDDVLSLAFSPDSKILASGNSFYASNQEIIGTINLWDMQTRKIIHNLKGHERATECVAFSPDSKILVSGGWDGTMRFWDVQTGKQLNVLTDKDTGGPVFSIAFSPDGRTFASGGWDGIVRLWDIETGVALKKMRQSGFLSSATSGVRSVTFSPDGETLAAGIMDGTTVMWNVKTGKRLKTLRNNPFPNAISPVKANK